MTDFGAAIRMPFSNLKRYFALSGLYLAVLALFILGIGIMVAPFINSVMLSLGAGSISAIGTNSAPYIISGLFMLLLAVLLSFVVCGYMLYCGKNASEGRFVLPEWKNFGNFFVKGFLISIIGLIYYLPIIAVAGLQEVFKESSGALTALMPLYFALVILFVYILYMVYMKFINEGFKAAFDIKDIIRRTFSAKYLVGMLAIIGIVLVTVIAAVILYIILMVNVFGIVLMPFVYVLVYAALYIVIMGIVGQLYRETSAARKPLAVPVKPKAAKKAKRTKKR